MRRARLSVLAALAVLAAPMAPAAGQVAVPVSADRVEYVGGDNAATGGHVVVEGDRLYVGAYGAGMRIFDIADPAAPRLIGGYLPGNRADAVPDAAVFDGRHIAVLNGTRRTTFPQDTRTDRSEFLDVTDPANPVVLHTFVGQVDGEAHNGDIVDARRWWLPSGGTGQNGLRIYDLQPLLGSPPAAPENLFRADPVALWESSPYRDGRPVGAGFTHTHDISVYVNYRGTGRDMALLAEGGSYLNDGGDTGSVFVIDITDPRDPVVLNRWLHERGPDHHPIRYHHEAQFLEGDPSVMLVTDEDLHNGCGAAGGVVAVRVSDDLTSAEELSEWFIPAGTPAPVCSAHVFSSHGNLVFMGSYNAGLQVIDYTDPAAPVQAGHFIADGATSWGAQYHAGYVYVGDMSRGLDVFRYVGAPDLAVTPDDLEVSARRARAGERITVSATVRNLGPAHASGVEVAFDVDGERIGDVQDVGDISAGGSATASVTWDTRGRQGEHEVGVTVDPANAIAEGDETNNRATRTVVVQGNKIRNGSFEASSDGEAPDHWTGAGDATRASGGSDGDWSVTAGARGSWTSVPVDVDPGSSHGVAVDVGGAGGSLVVEQLSASGTVVDTVSWSLPAVDGPLSVFTQTLTVPDGVAQVRIALRGPLLGTATFDDVWLWEA